MPLHTIVKFDAIACFCMVLPMKKKPSKTIILAWARLLRAQHGALSRVETALREAGLPPLSWYDALLELDRVGEEGMRPFELEQHLLLPQYGLSRLLDRIEMEGYVARHPCEDDGRGQIVAITSSGKAMRRRMWPVYAAALQRVVGDNLTEDEAATLGDLLDKLPKGPDG